jgi:uncharacterized membrane protein YhiD involved in acid resistance
MIENTASYTCIGISIGIGTFVHSTCHTVYISNRVVSLSPSASWLDARSCRRTPTGKIMMRQTLLLVVVVQEKYE